MDKIKTPANLADFLKTRKINAPIRARMAPLEFTPAKQSQISIVSATSTDQKVIYGCDEDIRSVKNELDYSQKSVAR